MKETPKKGYEDFIELLDIVDRIWNKKGEEAMNQDKPMFEDAKVGERIWNARFGWSTVKEIGGGGDYPITLEFNTREISTACITMCGRFMKSDRNPTYFYDEIKFDIPPRPKRMVKKTIERHVNVYPNRDDCSHVTEAEANICKSPDRIACVKLTGEYFVEE